MFHRTLKPYKKINQFLRLDLLLLLLLRSWRWLLRLLRLRRPPLKKFLAMAPNKSSTSLSSLSKGFGTTPPFIIARRASASSRALSIFLGSLLCHAPCTRFKTPSILMCAFDSPALCAPSTSRLNSPVNKSTSFAYFLNSIFSISSFCLRNLIKASLIS